MSHLVCAHPWEAASASAAATSVLISMISPSEGQAAKFVRPPVGASIAEQVAYSVADRQSGGPARPSAPQNVPPAATALSRPPPPNSIPPPPPPPPPPAPLPPIPLPHPPPP